MISTWDKAGSWRTDRTRKHSGIADQSGFAHDIFLAALI